MSYEQKYLKYKNKYLSLQYQIGGANNQINPPDNDLFLELENYINGQALRNYIVGVLQANMAGQVPAIINPPHHFNDDMIDLCRRFFNLFNNMNNQNRDNLVNRLLNLNLVVNNLPPGNDLVLELRNYINAQALRDYIVGVLQDNMGGQVPAIINPPNHFNNNMVDLCRRFFNLFNNMNNPNKDNLVNRLLNLNFH